MCLSLLFIILLEQILCLIDYLKKKFFGILYKKQIKRLHILIMSKLKALINQNVLFLPCVYIKI